MVFAPCFYLALHSTNSVRVAYKPSLMGRFASFWVAFSVSPVPVFDGLGV
jgi:hypothetical protein